MIRQENKILLIASFVKKDNQENFLKYINENFNIKDENVFIYEINGDIENNLLTFKLINSKRIDLNLYFSNSTIVNIKNGCIFSINGLNRLIELETENEKGNIDYVNYIINWEKYKDKLILCNKGSLVIKEIKKIK